MKVKGKKFVAIGITSAGEVEKIREGFTPITLTEDETKNYVDVVIRKINFCVEVETAELLKKLF